MLWVKAFHIVFVVTWFAGLFYLPRLFVYDVECQHPAVRAQLRIMQRRLIAITHVGGTLALLFGVWLLVLVPGYLQQHWLHLKLGLVLLLIGYDLSLVRLHRQLLHDRMRRSSRWLRLYNELPALLLIGIVLLVVLKPW